MRFGKIATPTMAHGPNGPVGANAPVLIIVFDPAHPLAGGEQALDDRERGRAVRGQLR